MLSMATPVVLAAEPEPESSSPVTVDEAASGDEDMLDTSRASVRAATEWLASGINSWFGDRPFEDGGKVTQGRFAVRTLWRQDDGWDFNVRLRAKVELPNLRDNAYFFFGQENEEELVSDRPDAFTREQQLLKTDRSDDQTAFAGLGVLLRENLDFRVGVRSAYKVYAQARYLHDWSLSERNHLQFRETVFWRVHDGFGSTTSLDYEHLRTPTLAFRWQNAVTITEETNDFAWGSSLGAFKSYGDDRLLSTELVITGETGSRHDVGEYGVRLKWQQPVLRRWRIGELIVGHYWPQDEENEERDRSWALGAGVEMRF